MYKENVYNFMLKKSFIKSKYLNSFSKAIFSPYSLESKTCYTFELRHVTMLKCTYLYFKDISKMTGAPEEVSWYDKDLDEFDITVDRPISEDENCEDESG